MTDHFTAAFEGVIDCWIERAVYYAGNSDTYLKYACIFASPIVGRYDGGTQQIATRQNRSVATVENWAHAHWLYKELRANGNKMLVRKLWRELPASHFWQAYDIQRRGYDALYYLTLAFQHNFSGRAMMGEFDKDIQAGNAPMQYKRQVHALRMLADEMLSKQVGHLTGPQRKALETVTTVFEAE